MAATKKRATVKKAQIINHGKTKLREKKKAPPKRTSAFTKETDHVDITDVIEKEMKAPLKSKVTAGYVKKGLMTPDQRTYGSKKAGAAVRKKRNIQEIRKKMKKKYPFALSKKKMTKV